MSRKWSCKRPAPSRWPIEAWIWKRARPVGSHWLGSPRHPRNSRSLWLSRTWWVSCQEASAEQTCHSQSQEWTKQFRLIFWTQSVLWVTKSYIFLVQVLLISIIYYFCYALRFSKSDYQQSKIFWLQEGAWKQACIKLQDQRDRIKMHRTLSVFTFSS